MSASSGDGEPVVEGKLGDNRDVELTERALRARIRQQEILAELGVLALQGASFTELLDHTVGLAPKAWAPNTARCWNICRARTDCSCAPASAGNRAWWAWRP
jgi:hypothetical protein